MFARKGTYPVPPRRSFSYRGTHDTDDGERTWRVVLTES
jgi:hypothetical protein